MVEGINKSPLKFSGFVVIFTDLHLVHLEGPDVEDLVKDSWSYLVQVREEAVSD